MTNNFRALCAELTEKPIELNGNFDIPSQSALIERSLNELESYKTTPVEPKIPTREELQELLYYKFTTSTGHGHSTDEIAFALDVLARWGNLPQSTTP